MNTELVIGMVVIAIIVGAISLILGFVRGIRTGYREGDKWPGSVIVSGQRLHCLCCGSNMIGHDGDDVCNDCIKSRVPGWKPKARVNAR